MRRYLPDPFMTALLATVLLASLLPCRGASAQLLHVATVFAIALMFFLYGVRLSPAAMRAGLLHWRLHALILLSTFVLYPSLVLLLERVLPDALPAPAWSGILFLAVLPSTVQSSIAFTSIAGGNVPGALCAATISNLLGTVLTPVLVTLLLRRRGQGVSTDQVWAIATQLLLPFIAGQACRRWLSAWASRRRAWLAWSDRGSILLVVYTAFSAAVVQGIWHRLSAWDLAALVGLELALLFAVILLLAYGSRLLRFAREDQIAIVFCGSKKSLATGVPIANVLFAGPSLGMTVIPVMLFHQMQLMVAGALARRYARAAAAGAAR